MRLSIDHDNAVTLARVQEPRVDAHLSGDLKARLLALTAADTNDLLIDLTEVRFIDSSGLGALIAAYRSLAARGGTLRLAGLQPQVRSVLQLTRLDKVFEVYASVGEALARAAQR